MQRAAAALMLCALGGLFLIIPSVSSDLPAAENHSLYSNWQAIPEPVAPAPLSEVKLGSFTLKRPASELFLRGWGEEIYDIVASVPPSRAEVENYFTARARNRIISPNAVPQTFRDWLLQRKEGVTDNLLLSSTNYVHDYVNNYLSNSAREGLLGLSFIRTIEWDYQTALGNRRWQGGLSALGALRETNKDAIVWQLRGYGAEQSSYGANAGLIYRRALRNALVGANVFFDYEQHGDADDAFTRWSIGGEYRNEYLDLYANRYFVISDAVEKDGELYYSQDGTDVQLNVNIAALRIGDVSGGLTYYRWEGDYGDADDKGLRYHLRFLPSSYRLNVELELDSPDGGSIDWGGRVSYRQRLGDKIGGGRGLPADKVFDARDHFFDVVRREYAQRIRRAGDGRDTAVRLSVISTVGVAVVRATEAGAANYTVAAATATLLTLTVGAEEELYPRVNTLSVTISVASTLMMRSADDWLVIGYEETDYLLRDEASLISLAFGTIFVDRQEHLSTLVGPNVTLALLGTRVLFGVPAPGAAATVSLAVYEGTVSIRAPFATRPTITIFRAPPGGNNRVSLNSLFSSSLILSVLATVGVPTENDPEPAAAIAYLELTGPFPDIPPALAPEANEPLLLTIGCGSARQRDQFRYYYQGADFGCQGDLQISDIAAGQTIQLVTQGETLALVGVDHDSNNSTPPKISVQAAGYFSRPLWDDYPFSPHNSVLDNSSGGGVAVSYDEEVVVDANSTVVFQYDDAASTEATAKVNMFVRSGAVSGIDEDGSSTSASVSCSGTDNLTPREEGQLSVIAACGDELEVTNTDHLYIGGRVSVTLASEVGFRGGNGQYRFNLSPISGPLPEALSLQNGSGSAATIALFSEVSLGINDDSQRNQLVVRPPEQLTQFFPPLTVTITAHVFGEFIADSAAPVTFRTALDSEIALQTLNFYGNVGTIKYSPPVYNPSDEDDHFVIAGNVEGSDRVTISLSSTPIDAPLTVSIAIAVRDDHSNPTLDATVTVTAVFIAEDPGEITHDSPRYVSGVTDGDYYVYSRVLGKTLATISGITNALHSGLTDSGSYQCSVSGTGSNFATESGGTRGNQCVLQVDDANLPAVQTHVVEVEIDDNHPRTDALAVPFSITLVEPVTLEALLHTTTVIVSSGVATLATVSVAMGYPPYSYDIPAGHVNPSDAAGLFETSENFITYNNTDYRDSREVSVSVRVTDRLGDTTTFELVVSVVAPLRLEGAPAAVSVHNTYGEAFYNPTDENLVRGGDGAGSYSFELVNGSGTHFAIVDQKGQPDSGAVSLTDDTLSGSVTVSVRAASAAGGSTARINYEQEVVVIDNSFSIEAGYTVIIFTGRTGAVATVTAVWGAGEGQQNDLNQLRSYRLVTDQLNPTTQDTGVGPTTGGVTVNAALPAPTVTVVIEAAVPPSAIQGVPPVTTSLVIISRDMISLADGKITPYFPSLEPRRIYTFDPQGGSGTAANYQYAPIGTLPGILEIRNGNELWQTGAVETSMAVTISVKVTDTTPGLQSSVTAGFTIEWQEGIHPGGYAVMASGDDGVAFVLNDVWAFQGGEGFEGKWIKLTDDGGFDERAHSAMAELNGSLYISGGTDNNNMLSNMVASTNGADWVLLTMGTPVNRERHQILPFNGALYIIGGFSGSRLGDVHRSVNGRTWESVDLSGGGFGNLSEHAALIHNNQIYLIGGRTGSGPNDFNRTVWVSDDVSEWSARAELPAGITVGSNNNRLRAVSHFGNLYIIEGNGSKPWVSEDNGASWEEVATTNAPGYGIVRNVFVQNTLIYVIGSNGLYASRDAKTWNRVTGDGVVPNDFGNGRTFYPVVVYTPPPLDIAIVGNPESELTPRLASAATLFTISVSGGIGAANLSVTISDDELPSIAIDDGEAYFSGIVNDDYDGRVEITVLGTDAAGTTVTAAVTLIIASPVLDDIVDGQRIFFFFRNLPVGSTLAFIGRGGGSGFSFVNPSDAVTAYLEIDKIGDLIYKAQAPAAQTLTVNVQASSRTRGVTNQIYTVRLEEPTHPDGLALMAGGDLEGLRRDIWHFQSGNPWAPVNAAGGFSPRRAHVMGELNGTLYMSGGRRADNSVAGDSWKSSNASRWEFVRRGFPNNRTDHQLVSFRNTLYIFGGGNVELGEVWGTADGTQWTQVASDQGYSKLLAMDAFVHSDGRLYVIGGYTPTGGRPLPNRNIWVADDINNWTSRPINNDEINIPGDARTHAVSHLGNIYIIENDGSEAWVSYDNGESWRLAAASPGYGAVRAAFAHDSSLYVLGENGLYGSYDGTEWVAVNSAPGISENRTDYPVIVYTPNSLTLSKDRVPPHIIVPHEGLNVIRPESINKVADYVLFTMDISGGFGAYTVNVTTSPQHGLPLPATIAGNGALALTGAIAAGYRATTRITISVTDSTGAAVAETVTIQFLPPLLSQPVRPFYHFTSSPAGWTLATLGRIVDSSYRFVNPSGGVNSYLAINDSGVVTYNGGASAGQTLVFTVEATSTAQTVTQSYTVRLLPPVHPNGVVGIAGGSGNRINGKDVWYFSSRTDRWTELTADGGFGQLFNHGMVEHNGSLYMSGDSGLWASSNLNQWRLLPRDDEELNRNSHQMVSFKDDLYLIGGFRGGLALGKITGSDIWKSSDGNTWIKVNTKGSGRSVGVRGRLSRAATFIHSDGYLYMLGGVTGREEGVGGSSSRQIWYSSDGANWNFHNLPDASDPPESGHLSTSCNVHGHIDTCIGPAAAVSYLGNIYFMEEDGSEVWVSEDDGRNWKSVVSASTLAYGASVRVAFVQNTLMYVVALNGTYSSSDGANWSQVTDAGITGVRSNYPYAVYTPPPLKISQGSNEYPIYSTSGNLSSGASLLTLNIQGGIGAYSVTMTSNDTRIAINNQGVIYPIEPLSLPPGSDGEQVMMTVSVTDGAGASDSITLNILFNRTRFFNPITRPFRAFAAAGQTILGTVGARNDISNANTYRIVGGTPAGITFVGENGEMVYRGGQAPQTLSFVVVGEQNGVSSSVQVTVILEPPVHPNGFLAFTGGDTDRDKIANSGDINLLRRNAFSNSGQDVFSVRNFADPSPFETRENHAMAALNGTLYLSGGYGSANELTSRIDIWASTDAYNWQRLTEGAPVDRVDHQMVSFNNALYIIGGRKISDGEFVDADKSVWRSLDGKTWSQVQTNSNFGQLAYHSAFVHSDGKLYLIGGRAFAVSITVNSAEVWFSVDAVNWEKQPNSPLTLTLDGKPGGVAQHTNDRNFAVSYLNKMFIIETDPVSSTNRIWISEDNGASWNLTMAGLEYGTVRWAFVQNTRMHVATSKALYRSVDGVNWANYGSGLNTRNTGAAVVYTPLPFSVTVHAPPAVIDSTRTSLTAGYQLFTVDVSDGWGRPTINIATAAEIGTNLAVQRTGSRFIVALERDALEYDEYVEMTIGVGNGGGSFTATVTVHFTPPLLLTSASPFFIFSSAPQGHKVKRIGCKTDCSYEFVNPSAEVSEYLEINNGELIYKGWEEGEAPGARTLIFDVRGERATMSVTRTYTVRLVAPVNPNGLVVATGGNTGSSSDDVYVYRSGDEDWTRLTGTGGYKATENHGMAAIDGALYIVGGVGSSRVYKTSNPAHFSQVHENRLLNRQGAGVLAFKGELYMFAGHDNLIVRRYRDVWKSSDGVTWQQLPVSAGFSSLAYFDTFIHEDNIYMIGGQTDGGRTNRKIWYSPDGMNWNFYEADESISDENIRRASGTSYLGKVYIMESDGGRVWESEDNGRNWEVAAEFDRVVVTMTMSDGSESTLTVAQGGFGAMVYNVFVHNTLMYARSRSDGMYSSADGANWTQVGDRDTVLPRNLDHVAIVSYTPTTLALTLSVINGAPSRVSVPQSSGRHLLTVALSGGWGQYTTNISSPPGLPVAWDATHNNVALTGPIGEDYHNHVTITVTVTDSTGSTAVTAVSFLIGNPLLVSPEAPFFFFTSHPESATLIKVGRVSNSSYRITNIASGDVTSHIQVNDRGDLIYSNRATTAQTLIFDIVAETENPPHMTLTATYTVKFGEPVHPNGYAIAIGGGVEGSAGRRDVWGFQSGSNNNNWQRLSDGDVLGERNDHTGAAINGRLYLTGGLIRRASDSYGWASYNAIDWTPVEGPVADSNKPIRTNAYNRFAHQMVSFKNTLYIIAGRENAGNLVRADVWRSGDGVTWTRRNNLGFGALFYHAAFVHSDGNMYIIGGNRINSRRQNEPNRQIWSSGDGLQWSNRGDLLPAAVSIPASTPRQMHAVSYRDKMYILEDNSRVWVSEDNGRRWSRATFTGNYGTNTAVRAAFVQNTLLYVLSGDGFYSTEGTRWTRLQSETELDAFDSDRHRYPIIVYTPRSSLSISSDVPGRVSPAFSSGDILFTVGIIGGFGSLTVNITSSALNLSINNIGVVRVQEDVARTFEQTVTMTVTASSATGGTVSATLRPFFLQALEAPMQSRAAVVKPVVDTDLELFAGEFRGLLGNLTYEAPTYSSHAANFAVKADNGSGGVTVSLIAPIPDYANITISIVAAVAAENITATVLVTVRARDALLFDLVNRADPNYETGVENGVTVEYYSANVLVGRATDLVVLNNIRTSRPLDIANRDGHLIRPAGANRALNTQTNRSNYRIFLSGGQNIICDTNDYYVASVSSDVFEGAGAGKKIYGRHYFRILCSNFRSRRVVPMALISTEQDRNKVILTVNTAFLDLQGSISYTGTTYSDDDLGSHFVVNAEDGSNNITVSLGAAIDEEGDLTIKIAAKDSRDDEVATLSITVQVRHPKGLEVIIIPAHRVMSRGPRLLDVPISSGADIYTARVSSIDGLNVGRYTLASYTVEQAVEQGTRIVSGRTETGVSTGGGYLVRLTGPDFSIERSNTPVAGTHVIISQFRVSHSQVDDLWVTVTVRFVPRTSDGNAAPQLPGGSGSEGVDAGFADADVPFTRAIETLPSVPAFESFAQPPSPMSSARIEAADTAFVNNSHLDMPGISPAAQFRFIAGSGAAALSAPDSENDLIKLNADRARSAFLTANGSEAAADIEFTRAAFIREPLSDLMPKPKPPVMNLIRRGKIPRGLLPI